MVNQGNGVERNEDAVEYARVHQKYRVLPLYAILLFFHKETTKGSFIFAENQSTALWLIARGPPPPRSSPEQHECLIFVARQEQVEKWFVGKPKYNWFKWYE